MLEEIDNLKIREDIVEAIFFSSTMCKHVCWKPKPGIKNIKFF